MKNKVIVCIRRIQLTDTKYHYCGYVGVPKDIYDKLPKCIQDTTFDLDAVVYDESINVLDNNIKVHGGITFAGTFHKDCDIIPITEIPLDYLDYFWYGFDLNHNHDRETGISTSFDYVKNETFILLNQINKLIRQYFHS